MPELPDVTVYIEALEARIRGERLKSIRLSNPFLLRSAEPPVSAVEDKQVVELCRIGKRIGIGLEDELWLIIHLMIAGRFHWHAAGTKIPGRRGLAAFDFSSGTLILTEAGTKRRASLHIARGRDSLVAHDPGGREVLEMDVGVFRESLLRRNHTLKRALTDPRIFSGIGNAYSDEILHAAGLSPVALTQKLSTTQIEGLYQATREILISWTDRLRTETGTGFPKKVTAFREGMAVHGRFGKPCPVCGTAVQRIRYASNETNYCPRCQTAGKLLADRSLSRLLNKDWPSTIDEFEQRTLSKE